jgi:hypothetical protein
VIDPLNAPHFTTARRDALALSAAARAAALRAEAAAIGAELDPDALEQGEP